jgi:hypothetical protein
LGRFSFLPLGGKPPRGGRETPRGSLPRGGFRPGGVVCLTAVATAAAVIA